jgi:sugar lactone lactonase YvrE
LLSILFRPRSFDPYDCRLRLEQLMSEVKLVLDARAEIGECPRWHPNENRLYWVDIHGPSVNSLDPETGHVRTWKMPEPIGCFSFRQGGGLIAGMQSGIFLVDLENGPSVERVFEYEVANLNTRFNDGRCDPGGRFWAGGMMETMDRRAASLFRYDPDGTCTRMMDKLICSNGLAFSPDGRTMYHSDSRQDYVWAWDFDVASGNISNQRVFLRVDIQEGRPDGAAVDVDGYYWNCHIGGWRVMRYSPEGVIDRVIGVPVQRPTMCAFGGKDLRTLYITSAIFPIAEPDLRKQPLAGGIFSIDVDVPGLPEPFFAG